MPAYRLLLAACLLVSGCAGSAAGAAVDPTGTWELVEMWRGSTVEPLPGGGRATLTVADGALGGTSFCNSYSAGYEQDGDGLEVEGLGGTEMGCAPELMTAETAYLEALAAVERVGSRDGYLVLTGPGVELRFRPLPPVPTAELLGTRWVLETLLDGEVASSTTGQPAELVLSDDGALTGSTGCRSFRGAWALEGDVLGVRGLAPDETGCPAAVAAQDAHVVGVLEGGVQVEVAGESLTLTGPDGLGLVYRAGA